MKRLSAGLPSGSVKFLVCQILVAATYFPSANRIQTSTRIRRAVAVVLALGVGVPLLLYVSLDGEQAVVSDEIRATTDESDVTLSDGVTEYQLSGSDSAQTVIMISGASVPDYIFDVTYDGLVDAGFRVLRYNYYGRGFSDQSVVRYDRALYERRISKLVGNLGPRKPYDSMGLPWVDWSPRRTHGKSGRREANRIRCSRAPTISTTRPP